MTTIDLRKIERRANLHTAVVGRRASITLPTGTVVEGTVTELTNGGQRHGRYGMYAVVTTDAGQWARSGDLLTLI